MQTLPVTFCAVLTILVVLAATYDFCFRRIPNWLNFSGLVVGLGLNLFFFHWRGAVSAAEGLTFAMAVYLPLYLLRGMGAGDVKLMATIGALIGPAHWLEIMILTALAGGVVGGGYAFLKGRFSETCCNLHFLLKDLVHFRSPHKTNPELDFRNPNSLRMPHGVIIAAACLTGMLLDHYDPKLLSNFVL